MGATLVDAGGPGSDEAIVGVLAGAGVRLGDLRRIVLTHQDLDHVGSLSALARASGARVLAHEAEAPFIDGSRRPRFAEPEVLERGPEYRPVVERLRPTLVDQLLTDGERLDLAGGVRVVSTPGHTPGHLCLYLERSRTLIAGDALLAHRGRVYGPSSEFSADLAAARRSVRRPYAHRAIPQEVERAAVIRDVVVRNAGSKGRGVFALRRFEPPTERLWRRHVAVRLWEPQLRGARHRQLLLAERAPTTCISALCAHLYPQGVSASAGGRTNEQTYVRIT